MTREEREEGWNEIKKEIKKIIYKVDLAISKLDNFKLEED